MPGVGDYTAAAVLSIAYNKPFIAIDGNVKRVIGRFLGLKKLSNRNMSRMKNYLTMNILTDNPGDFNQSIMELGAKICSPRNPYCGKCPLSFNCRAYAIGEPESYPLSIIKKNMLNLPSVKFVRMTGSGSSIIGYFNSKKASLNAAKILKKIYKNYWCILSKTI